MNEAAFLFFVMDTLAKKIIVPTGKMSNLVGLYFIKFRGLDFKPDSYYRGFIKGKVDDQHYLAQAIDFLAGEPNVIKIIHVSKMIDWLFFDSPESIEYHEERHMKGYEINVAL